MEAIDLYKYINDNNIEWHYQDNNGTDDVIIFTYAFQVEDFNKLIKKYVSDGGIECRMMDGYFAFWMNDICEHFGIELSKVFDPKDAH